MGVRILNDEAFDQFRSAHGETQRDWRSEIVHVEESAADAETREQLFDRVRQHLEGRLGRQI